MLLVRGHNRRRIINILLRSAVANRCLWASFVVFVILIGAHPTKGFEQRTTFPWMNRSLSPDQRADLVLKEMTLDEKIQMVHGVRWRGSSIPLGYNIGSGYVTGIDRLGIPDINMADSAVGISRGALMSRYSTLLPSVIGLAASWDPEAAQLFGSVIGRELRAQGFNMSIGGGVDLAREPRNGRTFEYAGEDPVLAGTIVGDLMKGIESHQIMGDIKHYALNDQETGRDILNAVLDKRAMQESDLLAFRIAIAIAQPAAVMCAFNKINGDYSCENDYTLNEVLKKEWGFKGWVLSDWGGTHSTTKAALAGLDQEMPGDTYFGTRLKQAVESGEVPEGRLDDMVHRILRSMFANGVVDNPPTRRVVDPFRGRDDAQRIAEESIVLLKNADAELPLKARRIHSIAVIGSHADVGVLSGGGSAQVDAPGGNAILTEPSPSRRDEAVYFPSAPLAYIRAKVPAARVEYSDGNDPSAAANLTRNTDVALIFVHQPMRESVDAPTLSLPDNQDALVSAVAAANPHCIVILETGGPVAMPWLNRVKAVLEAWYPGIGGGQAIANILFGDINPSGKLPITFANNDVDLPHPQVPGQNSGQSEKQPFNVDYTEGIMVGYKWFEALNKQPLFPFGYGLSYTSFTYSGLKITSEQHELSFTVRNSGQRPGVEVAQVYVLLPPSAGENFKRLVAWKRIPLAAGESRTVTVRPNSLYLSIFNSGKNIWELVPGKYTILVGPSSARTPLTGTMEVNSSYSD